MAKLFWKDSQISSHQLSFWDPWFLSRKTHSPKAMVSHPLSNFSCVWHLCTSRSWTETSLVRWNGNNSTLFLRSRTNFNPHIWYYFSIVTLWTGYSTSLATHALLIFVILEPVPVGPPFGGFPLLRFLRFPSQKGPTERPRRPNRRLGFRSIGRSVAWWQQKRQRQQQQQQQQQQRSDPSSARAFAFLFPLELRWNVYFDSLQAVFSSLVRMLPRFCKNHRILMIGSCFFVQYLNFFYKKSAEL